MDAPAASSSVSSSPPPNASSKALQFQPLASKVEVTFWNLLAKKKLDELKLNDDPIPIVGSYGCSVPLARSTDTGAAQAVAGHMTVASFSFETTPFVPLHQTRAVGTLYNSNQMEDFKKLDKSRLLAEAGRTVWDDILSGRALKNPSLLSRFLLLTYADLKTHVFYSWFGFPALVPSFFTSGAVVSAPVASPELDNTFVQQTSEPVAIHSFFSDQQIRELLASYRSACLQAMGEQTERKDQDSSRVVHVAPLSFFLVSRSKSGVVSVHPLSSYATQPSDQEIMLGFIDAGSLASHPGWHLRNFLVLAAVHFKLPETRILCFRDVSLASVPVLPASLPRLQSIVLSVSIAPIPVNRLAAPPSSTTQRPSLSGDVDESSAPNIQVVTLDRIAYPPASKLNTSILNVTIELRTVGWERNSKNKLGPNVIDLKGIMDPTRLAAESVDLNLKLMRWRILPSLDLPMIASTKCLLLGSGTLGCCVARTLLGWGVRHITFVDNGRVSYSNPVRQWLFYFNDCVGGGKPKAECAAENLKLVFPGVVSQGVNLTIPMPGHVISGTQVAQAQQDVERLIQLIKAHDVVFLLTDSRESRWLPTLLCAIHHKICINTALGFDTFVVMRHGDNHYSSTESKQTFGSSKLGCYFCNDVVAPGDSLTARTLDQQCTVTRPGLAPMSSAFAVELLMSLLHHPLRQRAPAVDVVTKDQPQRAELDDDDEPVEEHERKDNKGASPSMAATPLGLVPHQLRGFLNDFQIVQVRGQQFDRCTACSDKVLSTYEQRGFDFILEALNKPQYLEDLTGLTQLKQATDTMAWDEEVDDDF